jgi:hypothetical protein
MATVSIRYIVNDVERSIEFYCRNLGFQEVMHPAPTFAMLERGDLRLALSAPRGGAGGGQAMPDGSLPQPGGGTASCSRSTISPVQSSSYVSQERSSAATSWSELAATRFSWMIRPATQSNCSNRPTRERDSNPRDPEPSVLYPTRRPSQCPESALAEGAACDVKSPGVRFVRMCNQVAKPGRVLRCWRRIHVTSLIAGLPSLLVCFSGALALAVQGDAEADGGAVAWG